MKLVAIAALIAVCGAAKLDRTYLPPPSAATAGGGSDSLQTPLTKTSEQVESSGNLPTGSYTNNFQGVIVDAAGAGTRASPDADQSGLGGPRDSYGSQNSKVGDAAFRGSIAGFRNTPFGGSGLSGQLSDINVAQDFGSFESKSERPQASKDRNSNIISYANDVSLDNYSYGFESDNGIAVGENGVANNGIQAQGGYSYKGDDGQVYKVTYVADEGGYRPQGDHLPTPPPIPEEILKSLEQNAKDEAAGLIDDGSYDAQKYNAEGDYTHHNGGNIQYNSAQLSQFAKRPESDATASNTFINQNSQAFSKPGQFGNAGIQSVQSNQFVSNTENNQNSLIGSQNQESSQVVNGQQESLSSDVQGSGQFDRNSGSQLTQYGQVQGTLSSQFVNQNSQKVPVSQFGTQQSSQPNAQISPQESGSPSFGIFESQVHPQSTVQLNDETNKGSVFGASPTKPSFGTNFAFNSQQNQHVNQAFRPQGYFGAAEYLPPFNIKERPSHNKPQTNEASTFQVSSKDNQSHNFIPSSGQPQGLIQGSGTNSIATSSSFQPQTIQTSNDFQNKPPRPNQVNFNNGQFASNVSLTTQLPGSVGVSGSATPIKPTSIPSIELTTPLEPNEINGFTQGSQINSQTNLNFNSQPVNNAQPQIGFQNSIDNKPISQTSVTSQSTDSRPQGTSQFGTTSPAPNIFPVTEKPNANEEKPQPSQNLVGQIQQNNYYSTQKPEFSQSSDDSYYYNQPSKPFGTPGVGRPQVSRFPSTSSYQSNSFISSHNNQFLTHPGTQSSINNFPSSSSVVSVAPTTSPQFSQGSFPTNGITQASISPFPSASPTTSNQYDTTRPNRFGSKPIVPSFPSKPSITVGLNSPTSFGQNQIQFGQSSSSNTNLPSASQSFPSQPAPTSGQTTSFAQSQTQYEQSTTNNNQPQSPVINQQQNTTSTQTQQYEGTVYEYNKPPEVLPAPEQTDNSASQSIQTNLSSKPQESQQNHPQESRPQYGTQQTQFVRNQYSSQQFGLSQGTKPHSNSQSFKPFNNLQAGQNQFGQNSQSPISQTNTQKLQDTVQSTKPNQNLGFSTSTQFTENQQTGFEPKPQYGSQPVKPIESVSSLSQFGQNLHQQTPQTGVQSFKPFGGAQTTTQFGQNTQTSFGSGTPPNTGAQFTAQPNKPLAFGSASSQIGQVTPNQGSHTSGFISTQNLNSQNVQQPFGNVASTSSGFPSNHGSSGAQSFQGYPSSKPQLGNQLTLPQFNQNKQMVGTAQFSSQPQSDSVPVRQNTQLSQGSIPVSGPFGQQAFQTSQFGSSVSKPELGRQPQSGQNQNAPIKPFGNAFSQAQFGFNSAQASSSAAIQPSGVQAYKPFGASSGSNFQYQNKPQLDQAPQSSAVSTTSSPPQIGVQTFGTETQGSQSNSQVSQSVPCCKSINKDSAIAPLNVGKPSQAFALTQSQFTGFQGAQAFNTQNLAGKGEEFGGPRQPPSFDAQTGYHY